MATEASRALRNGWVVPGPGPRNTGEAGRYARTLDLRRGRSCYEHPDHVRVPLRGHVPWLNHHAVHAAVREIDRFLEGRRPGERLLVHCEHGVNRTGGVVAAWLCSHGACARESLDLFEEVRGARPRDDIVAWVRKNVWRWKR
jgi:hypothetical protein